MQVDENERITLRGDSKGKLHVQRQVEDYAFRGVEFEMMGFLSFIVETYERRDVYDTKKDEKAMEEEQKDARPKNESRRYLNHHPRSSTHIRVARSEDHNVLPNIVGSWLPRRDGEEGSKSFYCASMLAFLKPWRDLYHLKRDDETWESAFESYMTIASQREKDVVAGCQYYYDTRSVVEDRVVDEERDMRMDDDVGTDHYENEDRNDGDDEIMMFPVCYCCQV